jgi:hypothetical protein
MPVSHAGPRPRRSTHSRIGGAADRVANRGARPPRTRRSLLGPPLSSSSAVGSRNSPPTSCEHAVWNALREQLDEHTLRAVIDEGRSVSLEAAAQWEDGRVAVLLHVRSDAGVGDDSSGGDRLLQQAVVALVLIGVRNREVDKCVVKLL